MLSRRLFLRRAAVAPLLASPAITALASLAIPPVAAATQDEFPHSSWPYDDLTTITKAPSSWEAACYRAINAYIEHETKQIARKRILLANPNFKPYHHTYKELTP